MIAEGHFTPMQTNMQLHLRTQAQQTPRLGFNARDLPPRYGAPSRAAAATLGISGRLNPDFSLERNGYHIRIANGAEALKTQTAKLIERMYSSRGLFPYGTAVTLEKHETTIVACKEDVPVATMTLRMDVGDGLLADTLYSDEINSIRSTGERRVCEITRLAMDPVHGSHNALSGMVEVLYVLARLTHRVTDFFIEVHPRHAGFYQRLLGYRRVGPERICPRVGAPAVLLHLCHRTLDDLIERHAGRDDTESRSFYRLFATHAQLREMHRGLVRC